MKKFWSLLILVVFLVPMLVACAPAAPAAEAPSADAPGESQEEKLLNEILEGVEPLEKPVDMTWGILSDSQHGFVSYFLHQIGAYEKVGINDTFIVFGNGPVMVEALPANSWDIGTYGIGGTLAGGVGHGALVLGAATYDNALWIFASNDSDIVKAGKNVAESPELYGSAETWKGKNIFLPTGTTLQYALVKGLEKFGLTTEDVQLTHMDVPTVNTTLLSGQGEVGGVWSNFVFSKAIHEKFTPVIKSQDVDADMITVYAANPRSYADPEKKPAIVKWIEMYERVIDWLYDGTDTINQDKLDIFVQYYQQWNEENGIKSDVDELKDLVLLSTYIQLKENYELFHTEVETEDGKMSRIEQLNYDPLKFFISVGNYQPDSVQKLLDNTHLSEVIDQLYENK